MAILSIYLGALLRLGRPVNVLSEYTGASLLFVPLFVSAFYCLDLYNVQALGNGQLILQRLCLACAAGVLLTSTFFYLLPPYRFGLGIFLLDALCLLLLAYCWRGISQKTWGILVRPVATLVVGTGPGAEIVRQYLQNSDTRFDFVGFVSTISGHTTPPVSVNPVLGDLLDLGRLVRENSVRCIAVASDSVPLKLMPILTQVRFEGVSVYPAVGLCMRIAEELPIDLLSDPWLWFTDGLDLLEVQFSRRVKRLTDLLLSAVGLVLTLPLSVLAALAIKLDSPGPVLLRQRRLGRLGYPFDLIKFRSMYLDAEPDGKAQWATAGDPRVTRVGRILRRLHIDEIPQMINVLRGEMSFVGPRPERPEFVDQLKTQIPFYQLRHYVAPGITGWAQVRYPYGASIEDAKRKLQFDLYYILNASPVLDLRILLLTIRVLLFGGANHAVVTQVSQVERTQVDSGKVYY